MSSFAIVEAIKYIIDNDFQPKVIFSDSTTAISWFKNKRTASGKRNARLMKAEIYLRAMAYWVDEIKVVKWDNRAWGGNQQTSVINDMIRHIIEAYGIGALSMQQLFNSFREKAS